MQDVQYFAMYTVKNEVYICYVTAKSLGVLVYTFKNDTILEENNLTYMYAVTYMYILCNTTVKIKH